MTDKWLKNRTAAWIVILSLLTAGGAAPLAGVETMSEQKADFAGDFFRDEAHIWTTPARMNAGQWLLAAGFAATVFWVITRDEVFYRDIKDAQERNPWISDISPHITKTGAFVIPYGTAGLFWLAGKLFHDPKARDTGVLGLQALLHAGLVTQVIKHLSGRNRPEYAGGVDNWYGPSGFFKRYTNDLRKYDAFPSGHTATIWSIATVIATQYKSHFWVPLSCYTLATMSGLSRVTEDKHWLSDVIIGAAIGFSVGKYLVHKNQRRHAAKLQAAPLAGNGSLGLTLAYEW